VHHYVILHARLFVDHDALDVRAEYDAVADLHARRDVHLADQHRSRRDAGIGGHGGYVAFEWLDDHGQQTSIA
jgi:hypothetical protein